MRALLGMGPIAGPCSPCIDAIGVPRRESAMLGAFTAWRHVSDAQAMALS